MRVKAQSFRRLHQEDACYFWSASLFVDDVIGRQHQRFLRQHVLCEPDDFDPWDLWQKLQAQKEIEKLFLAHGVRNEISSSKEKRKRPPGMLHRKKQKKVPRINVCRCRKGARKDDIEERNQVRGGRLGGGE